MDHAGTSPPSLGLDIRPLTPETWDALADLFSQGGDARWCWCAWFHRRGSDWSDSTPDTNRALLRGLVEQGGAGRPPGLVALREGRAVGWVSLGPRESYQRLEHSRLLARVDEQPTWAIVCFVVGRDWRRRGVATALLHAAVAFAREQGARLLEAYPVDDSTGRVPSASAYPGTVSMYERAGFESVALRRAASNTRPRRIMRLAI